MDTMVLEPIKDPKYVVTPYVKEILDYSMAYLKADFPVHLCGPAGTGKTAMAFYLAGMLGQPVVVIHGDEEFKTSDLTGDETGYRLHRVVDRYISTVSKRDESFQKEWVDNRLTTACKNGFTLIYDEFTRSRPETNNVLLTVIEEKMLDLPNAGSQEQYLHVHPNFRAIFTSNPEEYAGIYKAQDALMNRLVTLNLAHIDKDTEVQITMSQGHAGEKDAKVIVNIVRAFRAKGKYKHAPTIREGIKIAKVLSAQKKSTSKDSEFFIGLCQHVLTTEVHCNHPGETKYQRGRTPGLFKAASNSNGAYNAALVLKLIEQFAPGGKNEKFQGNKQQR